MSGRQNAKWIAAASAGVLIFGLQSSRALTGSWTGLAAEGVWQTPGNWDVVPGATSGTTSPDIALFSGAPTSATITVDPNRNIAGMTFDSPTTAFTIGSAGINGGNTLYLSNGGTTQVTANVNPPTTAVINQINAPMILAGTSYTFTQNEPGTGGEMGGLQVRGSISGGSAAQTLLTLNGTHTTGTGSRAELWSTVSDGLSSRLSLTKDGAGTWKVIAPGSAPNTYSGDTNINNGTLRITTSGTAPDATDGLGGLSANSNYYVNNGGTLQVSVGTQSSATSFEPAVTARSVTVNSGGTFRVSTASVNLVNLKNNAGAALTLNYTSTVSNVSLPIHLTGTTAGQGGIQLISNPNAGTVDLGASSSVATFDLGTVMRPFDIGRGLTTNTYDLRIRNAISGGGASGGITKLGLGNLRIDNAANTFSGKLDIQAGEVRITSPNAFTGSVSISINSSATLSVSASATGTIPLLVNSGPALFLNYAAGNGSDVLAPISLTGAAAGEGGITLAAGASTTPVDIGATTSPFDLGTPLRKFDVAKGAATNTSYDLRLRGPVGGGGSTGGIVKTGAGILAFDNTVNAFTGKLEIQAGEVRINNDNALTGTPDLLIDGGNLHVYGGVGGTQTFGNVTLTKGSTTAGSSVTSTIKGLSFNLNVASPDTVAAATIFADSTGPAALTKTGSGKATLTGSNQYTGATTISGGTLELGDGGTTGSVAGNVTDNANLTFNRSSTYSFDGKISGTGSITKTGTGRLTLTANNTYTGASIINGGTLILNASAQAPVISNAGGAIVNSGLLVLDYTGGSDPSATVRSSLTAGFATNFTTGRFRTTNAVTPGRALGWRKDALNSQINIRYTYSGDATVDGVVDMSDFTAFSPNFGLTGKDWADGDFNYDGKINALDFNAIASNFGKAPLPSPDVVGLGTLFLGTLVPEPTMLVPMILAAGLGARRRRRGGFRS